MACACSITWALAPRSITPRASRAASRVLAPSASRTSRGVPIMTFITQAQAHAQARALALKPIGRGTLALLALAGAGATMSLAVVLFNLLTQGHSSFGTSNEVPWGLPIATYVFFVLTSTGLTFVVS